MLRLFGAGKDGDTLRPDIISVSSDLDDLLMDLHRYEVRLHRAAEVAERERHGSNE